MPLPQTRYGLPRNSSSRRDGGEAAAVPPAGRRQPQHLGERRAEVELVEERVLAPAAVGQARPADHQRHVRDALAGVAVLEVHAQLADRLAVVTADDDDGVLRDAELLERGKQLAGGLVGVAHGAVQGVDPASQFLPVADVVGDLLVPAFPARTPPVSGGAGAVDGAVIALDGLLVRELGQRRAGDGVDVLLRGHVGGVDVPVVGVDEPVVLGAVLAQPVEGQVGDGRGVLAAAGQLAAVVLGEAGGVPPGHVALGEPAEADGVPAGVLEDAHRACGPPGGASVRCRRSGAGWRGRRGR